MNGILQDVRYSLRQLRKSPGFTIVAVITLAIGIGATTAIFSIMDALLLRPLPYPNSSRIVRVWNTFAPRGMMEIPASEPELIEYQRNQSFDHLAGYSTGAVTLTGTAAPLRVAASWVSSDFFSVFGTPPLVGRVFSGDEYQSGQTQVIVLSFRLWNSRFAGDPGVVGKSITLNGQSCLVVGVMPRAFAFPSEETDAWQPLSISPISSNLGNHYLYLVGDVRPGMSFATALSDMAAILGRIEQKFPAYYSQAVGLGVRLVPLREQMVGNTRPTVLVLMAGVGFMLVIACANVASLLLARGEKRRTEVAARVALGATHYRILRQVLLEGLVLFLAGGLLGIVLAWVATRILSLQTNFRPGQADLIGLDLRVLAFAVVTCLFTGLLFGLIPALGASRSNFNDLLKTAGRNSAVGVRTRARSVLASSEIALSLVLLSGAGLMISSFSHLLGVNLGFNPENVITMRLSLPEKDYSLRRTVSFYKDLTEKIQAIQGAEAGAIVSQLPMSEVFANASFEVEGRPAGTDVSVADTNLISPGYFRAMEIPLVRGRQLSAEDAATPSVSIIVNQTFARKIWPGVDPLGKRIRLRSDAPWLTVVGIAEDIKSHGANAAAAAEMYFPYTDQPMGLWTDFRTATLVVRTWSSPDQIVGAIRAQLHDIDPNLPIYRVTTLKRIVSSSVAGTRFPTFVLSAFALLALALAAIGIYGVLAYTVAQSSREIGIRMALGATRGRILGSFVREALSWTAIGGGAGLAATSVLARYMQSLLFQVSPFDPKVFSFAAAILAVVGAAAAALPARRAAKVDPMVALRYE